MNELVFAVGISDIESLRKTISEIMTCTRLKCFSIVHESFDCVSVLSARKLVRGSFCALYNGNCEILLMEIGIYIKHTHCLFTRILFGCVHCVTLLPEEFAGTEEGTGGLLPTNDAAPLIVKLRKIAP